MIPAVAFLLITQLLRWVLFMSYLLIFSNLTMWPFTALKPTLIWDSSTSQKDTVVLLFCLFSLCYRISMFQVLWVTELESQEIFLHPTDTYKNILIVWHLPSHKHIFPCANSTEIVGTLWRNLGVRKRIER